MLCSDRWAALVAHRFWVAIHLAHILWLLCISCCSPLRRYLLIEKTIKDFPSVIMAGSPWMWVSAFEGLSYVVAVIKRS
jgi:hypothetical protein